MLIDIIRNSVKVFDLPAGMAIVVQPSSSGAVGTLSLAGGSVALTAASTSGAAGTAAGPFSAPCKVAVGAVGEVSVRIGPQKHLGVYAFANRPTAAAAGANGEIMVSDLGIGGGVRLVSDGADWHAINGSAMLFMSAMPVGIAPSGTMGANGALTLGTTHPVNYSTFPGMWWYFPAGAVSSGSAAGFYWTVMSSATAGTVYANTYTPGTDSGAAPASPTAVVDAGPGAYTGSTSEITAFSYTIHGGLMHKKSRVNVLAWLSNFNSGGNKTPKIKFGGTTGYTTVQTTNQGARVTQRIQNMGSVSKQLMTTTAGDGGTSGAGHTTGAVDTASDVIVSLTLQLAVATDTIVAQQFDVEYVG